MLIAPPPPAPVSFAPCAPAPRAASHCVSIRGGDTPSPAARCARSSSRRRPRELPVRRAFVPSSRGSGYQPGRGRDRGTRRSAWSRRDPGAVRRIAGRPRLRRRPVRLRPARLPARLAGRALYRSAHAWASSEWICGYLKFKADNVECHLSSIEGLAERAARELATKATQGRVCELRRLHGYVARGRHGRSPERVDWTSLGAPMHLLVMVRCLADRRLRADRG